MNELESKLQQLEGLNLGVELSDGAQRKLITEFLIKSQHLRIPPEDIRKKLHELHQKMYLITKPVCEWALKKVEDLTEENISLLQSTDQSSTDDCPIEPLFSKDTIYHASICCQALASCTAGDYQRFFKDREKVPGHSFEAVSISRPSPGQPHERYLIAKQGESKYYIAFESQPDLSLWQKKYRSFIEGDQFFHLLKYVLTSLFSITLGVGHERCKFPINYIVELLNKQGNSIVLTGILNDR